MKPDLAGNGRHEDRMHLLLVPEYQRSSVCDLRDYSYWPGSTGLRVLLCVISSESTQGSGTLRIHSKSNGSRRVEDMAWPLKKACRASIWTFFGVPRAYRKKVGMDVCLYPSTSKGCVPVIPAHRRGAKRILGLTVEPDQLTE